MVCNEGLYREFGQRCSCWLRIHKYISVSADLTALCPAVAKIQTLHFPLDLFGCKPLRCLRTFAVSSQKYPTRLCFQEGESLQAAILAITYRILSLRTISLYILLLSFIAFMLQWEGEGLAARWPVCPKAPHLPI